jgi:hypothetical protein
MERRALDLSLDMYWASLDVTVAVWSFTSSPVWSGSSSPVFSPDLTEPETELEPKLQTETVTDH